MPPWPGNPRTQRTSFGSLNRSELMARVVSRGNRTTEGKMLSLLRAAGLTGWRRHLALPGTPDFSWPKQRVAVFIHGCFWHGHRCGKNITPNTNAQLWQAKIERNRCRDRRVAHELSVRGWKVQCFWECRLNRAPASCMRRLNQHLAARDGKRNAQSS